MKHLKEYLKKLIKRIILGHTVRLTPTGDSMIFKLEDIGFFGKKNLLIKHRDTGKRISKPIKGSTVELFNYELEKMGELGIFDVYLKVKFGNLELLERTIFESENKQQFLINKHEKTIFSPYKTINSNLSFKLKEALFNHEIVLLESDQRSSVCKGSYRSL